MRSLVGEIVQLTNRIEKPPPYVGRTSVFSRMLHGRSDAEQQMRAMTSAGTLFAIIDRLAVGTAHVEWRLYKKAKSGSEEERAEVTSHAALDLWEKPNPFYTRPLFVETIQQHLDLTGESWWVVVRNPRMRALPLELWPVRPDRMTPVPHPEKYLAGYVYTGPDGEQIPLELDDVICLRRPNPLDPYRGIGPVQAVLADIDSAKYSAQWNRNFFINSAQPGGIHRVGRELNDDEFNQLRDRWAEQHQGVANAHRVAILEEGEFEQVTYTMRDMQFAELRNVQREIIREAFAFPKSELGTADDVNLANARAGSEMLARGQIVPRLERIKGALNAHLLPMFGATTKGLEFDYKSPVPEDEEAANAERTSKASAYKTYIDAGVDPGDAAEVVGLPALRMVEKPQPAPAVPAQPVEAPAARLQLSGHPHTHSPVAAIPAPRNASPDHSTGCMLALYPPPALAEQLAVPDGLPVADLHLTIAYCGKAADVDSDALLAAARSAANRDEITGKITGAARFTGGEDGDVVVALVDSPDLESLRRDVLDRLDTAGVEYPRDHGFTPHITLTYLDPGAESPVERLDNTPVTFSALSVVHGDDRTDLEFGGPAESVDQAHAHHHAGLRGIRAAEDVDPATLPDLDPIDTDWQAALADLMAEWLRVRAGWTTALVQAVRDAIASGQREELPQVEVPQEDVDEGSVVLTAAMVALALKAARRVTIEAAEQGVSIDPGDVDETELAAAASAVAVALARDAAMVAAQEALRVTASGDDSDEAADRAAESVRTTLERQGEARYRTWLGAALTQAQHAGRTATMRGAETGLAAPSVAYYAAERSDDRTCTLCKEVDGRWLGNTITEALAEYPTGGYIRCLGGPRCRGMVAAVWRPEQVGGGE